jgi:uncharacterized RDD family membrane protein YckC
MLYEAVLVFAIVAIAGLLFDFVTQSRHALKLRHARQAWLFLVLGAYFVYFWHRGGQTLAMKTWGIRLVAPGHAEVPTKKAIARYLLAWMWFLPGMAISYMMGLQGWASIVAISVTMILWALTIRGNPERQFLHDYLLGTRLIRL